MKTSFPYLFLILIIFFQACQGNDGTGVSKTAEKESSSGVTGFASASASDLNQENTAEAIAEFELLANMSVPLFGKKYHPNNDFLLEQTIIDRLKNTSSEEEKRKLVFSNRLKNQHKYKTILDKEVEVILKSDCSPEWVSINGFRLKYDPTKPKKFKDTIPIFPDSLAVLIYCHFKQGETSLKATVSLNDKIVETTPMSATDQAVKVLREPIPFSKFNISPDSYLKKQEYKEERQISDGSQ